MFGKWGYIVYCSLLMRVIEQGNIYTPVPRGL